MTLNTVTNGQVAPGNTEEQNLSITPNSQAVAIKAHPTNAGIVWVGAKGSGSAAKGFPLSAGEMITLDFKGTGISFTCANGADKISWISLAA